MTIQSEVLEIVREMQDVTASEVVELMPHAKQQTVYAALGVCEMSGQITSTKVQKGNRFVKQYRYGGVPKSLKPIKIATPTPAAMCANEASLKQRIAELEAWKADALARYPELAVDPIILKSRSIVSAMVEKEGDRRLAEDIRSGRKDATILVRAVAQALEAA